MSAGTRSSKSTVTTLEAMRRPPAPRSTMRASEGSPRTSCSTCGRTCHVNVGTKAAMPFTYPFPPVLAACLAYTTFAGWGSRMTLFTDTFTGTADQLLKDRSGWSVFGSGYTDEGAASVNAANQMKAPGGDGALIGQDTGGTSHFSEVRFYNTAQFSNASNSGARLAVAGVNRDTIIYVAYQPGEGLGLYQVGSGRVAGPTAYTDGQLIRVEKDGATNDYTVYIDDVEV